MLHFKQFYTCTYTQSNDYSEQKNESQKRACSIMILRMLLIFPISEHKSKS